MASLFFGDMPLLSEGDDIREEADRAKILLRNGVICKNVLAKATRVCNQKRTKERERGSCERESSDIDGDRLT